MSTNYDCLKWSRFRNIGGDFQNLLISKQAKQKVPDFGIPPSVKRCRLLAGSEWLAFKTRLNQPHCKE